MEQYNGVHHRSPPEAKIALFRSLFRGREDVYPRRFESRKTGKSGYAPACSQRMGRGHLRKAQDQVRAPVRHQHFLAVTDDVIRWHLSGQDDDGREFVMGIYPMLLDETCFFLAADLDKARLAGACTRRSWKHAGGSTWRRPWSDLVPATAGTSGCFSTRRSRRRWLASLVRMLLTETMERRPDIGLDSYDRFFPNQDTLPQGGFGNLIALPLQKRPRDSETVFSWTRILFPLPDQWAFLSAIRKMIAPRDRTDRPQRPKRRAALSACVLLRR